MAEEWSAAGTVHGVELFEDHCAQARELQTRGEARHLIGARLREAEVQLVDVSQLSSHNGSQRRCDTVGGCILSWIHLNLDLDSEGASVSKALPLQSSMVSPKWYL
ncbi:hypothetical protein GCM10008957_48520 [Deinococcus ruber]|uniref:Uncharacterized protein n=1 Tax=Deinococcus ruber TaxID=1848197 RepID=A0A918CNM1_9DEIO|nr:hypothetical protein GCM10008957_48520 [Deinococcus ruber]